MASRKAAAGPVTAAADVAAPTSAVQPAEAPASGRPATALAPAASPRPVVPPEVKERFLAGTGASASTGLVYRPGLLGTARLHYVHAKSGTDVWRTVALWAAPQGGETGDVWAAAEPLAEAEPELQAEPEASVSFAPLPSELARVKNYATWTKAFKDYLYRERSLTLRFCPTLKLFSQPEESEADFRIRLQISAREQRDLEAEKLKKKYEAKFTSLADQKRRAEERVAREKSQYRQQKMQTVISFGTSILGALFGRKLTSATNVSRAATAAKGMGRSLEQRGDIDRAEETTEQIEEKISKLEAEFQEEIAQIEHKSAADQLPVEDVPVQPRKTDIAVGTVCLAWRP
jgi:hypothetical protein